MTDKITNLRSLGGKNTKDWPSGQSPKGMSKQRKQVNFHGLVLPEIREYRIACAEEEKSMAKQTRVLILGWLKSRNKGKKP